MSFTDWVDSLSPAEQEAIIEAIVPVSEFTREVFEPIFAAYERIASRKFYVDYVESITSPLLWSTAEFAQPLSRYREVHVFTDPASWTAPARPGVSFGAPAAGTPILDGLRWYYYIDVTEQACLDPARGPAYDALLSRFTPWREDPDDASASACNRFWFVDPSFTSSASPAAAQLGSFDQYGAWFADPERAMALHQDLVVGDLLTDLYAPLAVILDAIHYDVYAQPRPRNAWDDRLERHRLDVAELAAVDGTFDYITYDVLIERSWLLRAFGATFEVFLTEAWSRVLDQLLDPDRRLEDAIALMTEVYHRENWLAPEFDDSFQQPVPSNFVRIAVDGTGSVADRLAEGESIGALEGELEWTVRDHAAGLHTAIWH
ncbi:MAG: hypothetical protein AAFX94_12530 [Myxococcota bacterium]